MDVLVFKTSVSNQEEIEQLRASLNPLGKWNSDLEDCDRILRIAIEFGETQPADVLKIVQEQGFYCAELD